jgi:hypothetical protein
MTNVRRIMRYSESPESKKETDKTEKACLDTTIFYIFRIGIIQNMFSWLSLNRSNCFVGF